MELGVVCGFLKTFFKFSCVSPSSPFILFVVIPRCVIESSVHFLHLSCSSKPRLDEASAEISPLMTSTLDQVVVVSVC